MGLLHIMERGGEELDRFEAAIYDIKDAIEEICSTYEKMKSEYGERSAASSRGGYSSRGSYYRTDGGYGERHSRR